MTVAVAVIGKGMSSLAPTVKVYSVLVSASKSPLTTMLPLGCTVNGRLVGAVCKLKRIEVASWSGSFADTTNTSVPLPVSSETVKL